MRSGDQIVRLWQQGHSAYAIAKKMRLAATTVYKSLQAAGGGQLPRRPWAGSAEIGIGHETLKRWASHGLIRRQGSQFNTDDIRAHIEGMKSRQCAHWRCENLVESRSSYVRFCPRHRNDGVDPQKVLDLLRLYPGLSTAQIYLRLSARAETATPALNGMVAAGLLVTEPVKSGGRKFYLAEHESK